MMERIARLTSGIFSPFLIGLILILLVSLEATMSLLGAVKWSLILIAQSILPTLIFTIFLVRDNRLDGFFSSSRRQRIRIYILILVLAAVSSLTLFILKAPLMLLALAVTGLSGSVVFAVINQWWKISLHTAFITAMATMLFILHGFLGVALLPLIPLVAWSRVILRQHSMAQTAIGAILGVIILVVIFSLFGLVAVFKTGS